MVTKDDAFSKIAASGTLPTLPEILLELLSACDADIPLDEIGVLIKKDPSMSLRVMQLVNSAYYGLRHSFNRIEQAVVYLGAQTIKNLAVTLSVQALFTARQFQSIETFDPKAYWFHSLFCATLAKRVAQKLDHVNGDEAYLAGLMHDSGKLLLARTFPQAWSTLPAKEAGWLARGAAETELCGVNHAQTGAWLMRQWNLNPVIGDAIAYHHETPEQITEAFPLVKVVYLANLLANQNGEKECSKEVQTIAESILAFDAGDLREILDGARQEVSEIAETLGLPIAHEAKDSSIGSGNAADDVEESLEQGDREGSRNDTGTTGTQQIIAEQMERRVKDVSLLTTFLESFIKAETVDLVFGVFEEALHLLCGVDSSLLFVPDRDGLTLQAASSGKNRLHEHSKALTLRLQQSSSKLVSVYRERVWGRIEFNSGAVNLADQQLLSVLRSSAALLVPLLVEDKAMGVAVIGLNANCDEFDREHRSVIRALAGQLALCLHVDELKTCKAQELQEEKMAAIATTARKFAHEINNPLGIISNYLMTIRLQLEGNDEILEQLTIVDDEIQRIATMVGEMEMYSQAPFTRFETMDINELIKDVIRLIKPSLFDQKGSVLSFIPGSDIPYIKTSRDAIKQILINLLKNAAEAMGNSGRAVVRTRRVESNGGQDSGGLEIIVADTGPGLPEKVLANLYEPFITTKTSGHSGLGLSIVQKAVQQIGGRMSCVSSASQGTTFTIFIRDVHTNSAG